MDNSPAYNNGYRAGYDEQNATNPYSVEDVVNFNDWEKGREFGVFHACEDTYYDNEYDNERDVAKWLEFNDKVVCMIYLIIVIAVIGL